MRLSRLPTFRLGDVCHPLYPSTPDFEATGMAILLATDMIHGLESGITARHIAANTGMQPARRVPQGPAKSSSTNGKDTRSNG